MHDRAKSNDKYYQDRVEQNEKRIEEQREIIDKLQRVSIYVNYLLKEVEK